MHRNEWVQRSSENTNVRTHQENALPTREIRRKWRRPQVSPQQAEPKPQAHCRHCHATCSQAERSRRLSLVVADEDLLIISRSYPQATAPLGAYLGARCSANFIARMHARMDQLEKGLTHSNSSSSSRWGGGGSGGGGRSTTRTSHSARTARNAGGGRV
jgi:uncharacterized membrane protein YgcG